METGCILVWGVVSICRRLLSPSTPSWSLGTHFSAGLLHSVDLSPLEATPPSTHPAKFHVCPQPQGTLSKFTLGQLGSSHGPVNALRVEVGVGDGAGSWEEEPVQVPGENKGSWERDFKAPHFPTSASPELTVNPNLLRFRRGLPTHTTIFTLLPKGHTQQ